MIKSANLTGSISRNAGGLFESVRRLVQSLAEKGMDIQVLGIADEHTAADIGAWAPVTARVFHHIGPRQFGYSPDYRKALIEFSPDLVHTHGLWIFPSIATNQYCHPRGVPYVISPHGMLDPWAVRHSRWKKAAAHFFYEGTHLREAHCLRALCEAEARAIRQSGLKNPIAVIPNGIDIPIIPNAENLKTETLKPEEQKAENRKPKIGNKAEFQLSAFAGGRKTLLYLGRIHPKKGLINLLKAWAEVCKAEGGKRKADEWVLAITGWDQGGHERELRMLSAECGIQNSVTFLGPKFGEDKAACYHNCDAFILPSFSEGLPMVVLEAWAYGKPVLMTPESNLPEGYTAKAAIRIETSVEGISRGLQELFRSSDSALRDIGNNGRALAAGRFNWPKIAVEMKSVYEWVLGGGPKPDCVILSK